jgi:hypothetical protein
MPSRYRRITPCQTIFATACFLECCSHANEQESQRVDYLAIAGGDLVICSLPNRETNDRMSDEPKKRSRAWISWTALALVSFEDLNEDQQSESLDFVAVPEDVAAPAAMIRTWWTHEGMDALEVTRVLDDLVDRSLLRVDDHDQYTLHDVSLRRQPNRQGSTREVANPCGRSRYCGHAMLVTQRAQQKTPRSRASQPGGSSGGDRI